MTELTKEELSGLRMGVIDLYRQYSPENAFDDREFLIREKKSHTSIRWSLKKKPDIIKYSLDSEDSDDIPSLHEDTAPYGNKKSCKANDARFSLKTVDIQSEIQKQELLKKLKKENLVSEKPFPRIEPEITVTDEEVAEHKRKRLAEEAKARTASTYQKLEMLPTTQTAKTTSRDRLVEKRSKEYSPFDQIGFWIDKILGKERPKSIQYTGAFNEIPLAPTFSEMLINIIQEKNLENPDVYKKAQMDRRLFSRIISNQYYSPSRETVFCLIIALKLNIEEATDFMATAGYAFKRNNITDVVVEYFIRTNNYDLFYLNQVLQSLNQSPLAAKGISD